MRISDWSSDVCSSDLPPEIAEWYVGIADGEKDAILLRLMRSIARDVPGALPMADDDQLVWPAAGSTQGILLKSRHFLSSARQPREFPQISMWGLVRRHLSRHGSSHSRSGRSATRSPRSEGRSLGQGGD